jgi:hypothetical protein
MPTEAQRAADNRSLYPKREALYQHLYRIRYPQVQVARGIKQRSKAKGIPVDTEYLRSIKCPEKCPVFGYDIKFGRPYRGKGSLRNMASFDRINPDLGYVPGNVQIISMFANSMKQDASKEELEVFARWVLR